MVKMSLPLRFLLRQRGRTCYAALSVPRFQCSSSSFTYAPPLLEDHDQAHQGPVRSFLRTSHGHSEWRKYEQGSRFLSTSSSGDSSGGGSEINPAEEKGAELSGSANDGETKDSPFKPNEIEDIPFISAANEVSHNQAVDLNVDSVTIEGSLDKPEPPVIGADEPPEVLPHNPPNVILDAAFESELLVNGGGTTGSTEIDLSSPIDDEVFDSTDKPEHRVVENAEEASSIKEDVAGAIQDLTAISENSEENFERERKQKEEAYLKGFGAEIYDESEGEEEEGSVQKSRLNYAVSRQLPFEEQIHRAPKRLRKHLIERYIKSLRKQKAKEKAKPDAIRKMFKMKVMDVNRTWKVTKAGGIQSFTAFVVCGNHKGVAGFGKGKSSQVGPAVEKAYKRALKNLHYFDLFMGRTIYHDQEAKYGKTKIRLFTAEPGTGIRACPMLKQILYLSGYKDMKTKVIGSTHPHNTVKALFKALCLVDTPEELLDKQ